MTDTQRIAQKVKNFTWRMISTQCPSWEWQLRWEMLMNYPRRLRAGISTRVCGSFWFRWCLCCSSLSRWRMMCRTLLFTRLHPTFTFADFFALSSSTLSWSRILSKVSWCYITSIHTQRNLTKYIWQSLLQACNFLGDSLLRLRICSCWQLGAQFSTALPISWVSWSCA